MSQFEQENDLGRGGGEVDAETMDDAWRHAAERRSTANMEAADADEGREPPDEPGGDDDLEGPGGLPDDPDPWAKTSSGDTDA